MAVQSVNPATEEVLATFEEHSQRQIDEVLDQSVKSFRDWRDRPFAERARLMHAAAAELRRDAERYALLITQEMGKPIAQSKAEVEKCAWCCDYFADNAEALPRRYPVAQLRQRKLRRLRSRSARCWRSCPGTFPSGRCSASPRRR